MITVKINDKTEMIAHGTTVEKLLLSKALLGVGGLAVAVNGRVVPKANHSEHVIEDGDVIVMIRAAYGG